MSQTDVDLAVPQLRPIDTDERREPELTTTRPEAKDSDWKEIHDKVKARDTAMLKDYDDEVDTLLVFAGLFSAILTAFIVDVYQDLKVDSSDTAATLLQQILLEMQGHPAANAALSGKADPSATTIVVISLWFASLILSLLAALFGIFMKQWLHVYSKWTEVAQVKSLQQGLILRGFYQASFGTWHIADIFAALGVLLQLALILFVVGLVGYLWTLSFVVSPIVTAFVLVMVVLSIVAIFLPVFREDCPYKFPLAYLLVKLRTRTSERDWTERDLPIAQRRLAHNGHPLDKAVAETALLLDVYPEILDLAVRPERWGHVSKEQLLIQDRIRQLSPDSTILLTAVVTSENLLARHKTALQQSDESDGEKPDFTVVLLCFWTLVFGSMLNPPIGVMRALHHLASTLDSMAGAEPAIEQQYATLLVDVVLVQCCTLRVNERPLTEQLSSIALIVDAWATRKHNSTSPEVAARLPLRFISFLALRALYHAASIVASAETAAPATGLSPLTPYLGMLSTLRTRIDITSARFSAPDVSVANSDQLHIIVPVSLLLDEMLLADSENLHQRLTSLHDSFLCTQRRGYTTAEGKTDEPRVVIFDTESKRLFVGTDEAAAWILDLASRRSTSATPSTLPSGTYFHQAKSSRDISRIAWGSREGPVLLLDRTVDPPVQSVLDSGQGKRSYPLAISRDGRHVLVSSENPAALLLDTATGEVLMSLEGHTKRLCRAAFAPHVPEAPQNYVATSSFDNTVKVWDIDSGYAVMTFSDLGHSVNGVAWTPNGQYLAISSANTIRVFDAHTGELQGALEGHTKLVTCMAVSPNSAFLASSSDDKTVRVWNVAKRTCIATLTGPKGECNFVDFSPNGSYIACAADDAVWIWDVNPSSVHRTSNLAVFRRAAHRAIKLQKLTRNVGGPAVPQVA